MPRAKTQKTAGKAGSSYRDKIGKLGLPNIEAFRRADLKGDLRSKAGITPEDEHRLTACMELGRMGVPIEVAEALVQSDSIGSASEFVSLEAAEVEQLLGDRSLKRLLPGFVVDREVIEGWLQRATPLTADEAAPGRSALAEARIAAFAVEDDAALTAEDSMIAPARLIDVLSVLKKSWSQAEATIAATARTKSSLLDGDAARIALLQLKEEIGVAIDLIAAPRGEFVAIDEVEAASVGDENVEPSHELLHLQRELVRLEGRMEGLRTVSVAASEADEPAAAVEAGSDEHEAAAFREE